MATRPKLARKKAPAANAAVPASLPNTDPDAALHRQSQQHDQQQPRMLHNKGDGIAHPLEQLRQAPRDARDHLIKPGGIVRDQPLHPRLKSIHQIGLSLREEFQIIRLVSGQHPQRGEFLLRRDDAVAPLQ